MIRPRARALLLFASLAVLVPRFAAADEASGKAHFKAGVDLYDAQDYERALVEFRAAYDELHLYVIKRNIALALRGLHRYAEAIEALEEYLAEGGDKIDAQLRQAAEATITEMSAQIGTVRVVFDEHEGRGAPQVPVVLTIDDQVVPPEKARLPLRVDAGVEHTFRAHADGFADGVAKVTVSPGQRDVLVRLELVPVTVLGRGTLRVHASVPAATIRVDGGPPQVGDWSGELRVGPHRVTVEARGYARVTQDVALAPDVTQDLPVTLVAVAAPPPIGSGERPPSRPAQKVRPWYGVAGLSLQGQTMTLGAVLDPNEDRHSFGGASLTLKVGRMLSRATNAHWALEGMLELGGSKATFTDPNVTTAKVDATVTMFNWALAPELVYRSGGTFQLVGGTALGLEGEYVDGQFLVNGSTVDKKGGGFGAMWLLELGAELRFKRAFVQALGFFDVHWDGTVTDRATGDRYFLETPVGRAGVRVMVGVPLF